MILRRLENSRFSDVLQTWAGETVVLIGGGPSLAEEQISTAHNAWAAGKARCIVVNDAYLLAPWADVQYAADAHWHRWHTEGIPKPAIGLSAADVARRWAEFTGQKCSIENSAPNIADNEVHILRNQTYPSHSRGLSLDPRALVTGHNSGFQALNLAVLAGAKRIILLGYDGGPSKEGKTHWFGDHPRPTPQAFWPYCHQAMSAAESALLDAGVEVLNCSPGSAINSFRKVGIKDVFA